MAQVMNTFFASVFADKTSLQQSQVLETREGRLTLGGEGAGQGILKQTGCTKVHGP